MVPVLLGIDREQALAAGFSEYLTKPVDVNRLASVMESLLRARGAG